MGRSEDDGERREWSWRGKGRGSHDKVMIKALFFWKEKLGELKFVFITSKIIIHMSGVKLKVLFSAVYIPVQYVGIQELHATSISSFP